jgi:acetoin utilization deacetylase AcuC-like enzyme
MPDSPTAFFLHPASALHDTGWAHPENQGRLRALASIVGQDLPALADRVVYAEARDALEEEVRWVHTAEHLSRVREAVDIAAKNRRIVGLDPDTRVSGASWEAALGATGAVLAAVENVANDTYANAFVAARPPGHHATPDRAMGFCLFNSVAVAARWLQDRGESDKVLVVDWDVHHGNGTQDIFYEDPSVFYLSLHQYPHFPGTGAASEKGEGQGKDTTLNVPLTPWTPTEEYLEAFEEALDRAYDSFVPDFILVSAGFDVLAGDPLGSQMLEPRDLHFIMSRIIALAEETCSGRVVAAMEGGYDPVLTGQGAVAVIRALAGVETTEAFGG